MGSNYAKHWLVFESQLFLDIIKLTSDTFLIFNRDIFLSYTTCPVYRIYSHLVNHMLGTCMLSVSCFLLNKNIEVENLWIHVKNILLYVPYLVTSGVLSQSHWRSSQRSQYPIWWPFLLSFSLLLPDKIDIN